MSGGGHEGDLGTCKSAAIAATESFCATLLKRLKTGSFSFLGAWRPWSLNAFPLFGISIRRNDRPNLLLLRLRRFRGFKRTLGQKLGGIFAWRCGVEMVGREDLLLWKFAGASFFIFLVRARGCGLKVVGMMFGGFSFQHEGAIVGDCTCSGLVNSHMICWARLSY